MSERTQNDLLKYISSVWGGEDALMLKARQKSDELGLTRISISAIEGNLVHFFINQVRAQKVVELGTLTGYSAQWILKAMPSQGRLWTFEKSSVHAAKAREVLKSYIDENRVTILEGDAVELLPTINAEGPFDAIFIDANKLAYGQYLDWAEKNLRKGGVILADNALLGGTVVSGQANDTFSDKQIAAMKEFNLRLSNSEKYLSAMLPTTEGLLVAIKNF